MPQISPAATPPGPEGPVRCIQPLCSRFNTTRGASTAVCSARKAAYRAQDMRYALRASLGGLLTLLAIAGMAQVRVTVRRGRSVRQAAAVRRRPPLHSMPSRLLEQRAGHKQPNPERLLSAQRFHHLCTAGCTGTGTAAKALPRSVWTWQTLPVVKGHSSTLSASCPPLHPAARARARASRQP